MGRILPCLTDARPGTFQGGAEPSRCSSWHPTPSAKAMRRMANVAPIVDTLRREHEELEAIKASRPLGSKTHNEPKSIHQPVAPSRLQFVRPGMGPKAPKAKVDNRQTPIKVPNLVNVGHYVPVRFYGDVSKRRPER
jgi:hypothetical protein